VRVDRYGEFKPHHFGEAVRDAADSTLGSYCFKSEAVKETRRADGELVVHYALTPGSGAATTCATGSLYYSFVVEPPKILSVDLVNKLQVRGLCKKLLRRALPLIGRRIPH